MIKAIKILHWNAQSITDTFKRTELELLLNAERIDVVLLAETFLKPHLSFDLKDFVIYRNDRTTHPHGGVAICVRKSLPHKLRSPFDTNSIENIAIELNINKKPTCIIAAYSPKYSHNFINDIQTLTSLNMQYLLMGDLNAKHTSWNCIKNNQAGIALFNLHQQSQFVIHHTPVHTHFPHSGQTPSTIDLSLSNVNFNFELTALTGQLSSDHTPIVCEILANTDLNHKPLFDYKKADWNKFQRYITHNINEIRLPTSRQEIDYAIDRFSILLVNARAISVPVFQPKNKPNISTNTKQLIQQKNALNRLWQRTIPLAEKQQIKTEINRLQKLIKKCVNDDINQQWAAQLRNINKCGKKLWSLSKKFKGKNESTVNKIKIPGLQSIDDSDRANQLAKIYKKSHDLTRSFTHDNDSMVRNSIRNFESMYYFDSQCPSIAADEISNIIKCMRPFKAPGPDSIQNILLKNLPSNAIVWLTNSINACLKFNYWPTSFKTAKIVPILKAGKPATDAHSYRPISLLNAIGKILEKVIYNRLIAHIDDNQLLPDFQFGFRKGHSTTHQAMRIKKFIERNKRRKWSTGLVLLDIEKAFDSIWHDGLIYKLIQLKLPLYLVRMTDAFIRNRKFMVHVNNSTSDVMSMPAGLAQGTSISPILYSLFIADMPEFKSIDLALYADDTAAFTAAKQSNVIVHRLTQTLQNLELYFNKWKIKINANKTQAILFPFDNKRRRIPSKVIKSNNKIIELQKSVNYLGIHFDTKLTFNTHITKAIEKANKCFAALYPMLSPRSQLSTINKSIIYTAVIRPILAYGSPIWSSAARTHLQKFTVIQNKFLKTIYKIPFRTRTALVLNITKLPHFIVFINSLNNNFTINCRSSEFNMIREIDLL